MIDSFYTNSKTSAHISKRIETANYSSDSDEIEFSNNMNQHDSYSIDESNDDNDSDESNDNNNSDDESNDNNNSNDENRIPKVNEQMEEEESFLDNEMNNSFDTKRQNIAQQDMELTYESNKYDFDNDPDLLDDSNEVFYTNQKEALKWINISNLIVKNAKYFGLTSDEANLAIIELHHLLTMDFSVMKQSIPGAISILSNFENFWSTLKDFEYCGHTFDHIAMIAFRLNAIPPSEAGAERAFSNIKWKYPERRNRAGHDSMIHEIHIDQYVRQKLESKDPNSIWKLPPHINKQ